MRLKNKGTVPSGMLAPSGYTQTEPDPVVQSTTRPAGSLLPPSPGYDSVRVGKNRFQGKGPTGGFRPMEFAEDVGGSGAALAVTPGDTSQIEKTEWLPESEDSLPEGSMIVSDRKGGKHHAHELHEGERTIPDMGDRSPGRPRSRLLINPAQVLRDDYRKNPVLTVLATAGLVGLIFVVTNDLEQEYRRRRGRGVASGVTAAPAAAEATSGDEVSKATDKIGDAANQAVEKIESAAQDAVGAIEDAGKAAKETAKSAADTTQGE